MNAPSARTDRPHGADLFFRVLGPLKAVRSREELNIGGPKEQLVLALLLVRANEVVAVDALAEAVWAGRPPRSAERTLQSYVARLRGALEPARAAGAPSTVLVTVSPGYRLQIANTQLDALRFEDLARRGGEELRRGDDGAAHTLHRALALWAGDAYAEFVDVEACEVESRRLAELRLVALEDRIEADLVGGASAEAVAELEALVADHPFRERLWHPLMLALYRAGRQRDALAAYQRARSVLAEQVGIEPGPELRQLEAAILAQSPTLDRVRPAPGPDFTLPLPLEAVGPAFVGRDAELSWLRSAWAEAAAGEGRFVSILGPEGMGKTRLVAAVAQEVQAAGALVLYGRCDHAHRSARPLLDQALRSGGSSLAQVEGGETPLGDLAGAVARHVATWAQHQPVLLALDDLHLADDETLEVVADLSEWSASGPMLVVAAFRTDDQPPTGPSAGIDATTTQVALGGLDREAVRQLCSLYAPAGWSGDEVSRLQELTGGVPLQVHEQASEWARQRAAHLVEEANDRSTVARLRLATSREEVADSVEGIQHLLEERRANLAAREAELADDSGTVGAFQPCPYKGLAAFEAADAANFFGRERLVAELVARLAGARFLWVVGASGSGKSSLVRAGLLPALAAGVIPATNGWNALTVTPGVHPARALARWRASNGEAAGRRIVFIDQFEEAFTLCADGSERDEFVDGVVALAGRDDTVVVVAIRADQLDHCAAIPELADLMTGNDVVVGPMHEAELRRVIERPARRAGLTVEPGLVDVIVADVAGRSGALPLLSTALAETWERRTERTLTLAGYRAAGGVNGALARLAEEAYQSLGTDARAAARRMLLRLCDAGDESALDLRRRLDLAELVPEGDADARSVVETLVGRRLLTVDGDTVEVAHEALLREWPRLRHWLDDDVQGRHIQRRIGESARTWRAGGEDRSELYRGTRLDAAVDWSASHPADLNEAEQAFLDASRREAAREIDEAHQQAADRAIANRRLRVLLGGVALLLVVALLSGVLFLGQRNRAEEARRTATARDLASQSTVALAEDPELAILLALEAVDTARSAGDVALPEAISALQEAVQTSRMVYRREEAGRYLDASADGTLLVTSAIEPTSAAIVWDARTGEILQTLAGPEVRDVATGAQLSAPVRDVAISRDERYVAVSYDYTTGDDDMIPEAVPAVVLWDAASGREVSQLMAPPAAYLTVQLDRDGRRVVALASTGAITVWDVATSAPLPSLQPPPEGAGDVTFLPDGRSLAVSEYGQEQVAFYSVADGQRLDVLATPGFSSDMAVPDPSNQFLVLASQQSARVVLWDLTARYEVWTINTPDGGLPAWSPESDRLALGGGNQSLIQILDPSTGEATMVLSGHESGVWGLAYVDGGDRLASVGAAGGLRVWDVTSDGPPALGAISAPAAVAFQFTAAAELLLFYRDGTIQRLDANTDEGLGDALAGQVIDLSVHPTFSSDGRLLASVDEAGHSILRDLATFDPLRTLPPCTYAAGFSRDGSLLVLDGTILCDSVDAQFIPGERTDLRSRVIEVDTGEEILDLGERNRHFGAAFNPAGEFPEDRYLAVNVEYQQIDIYDVESQELLATLDSGTDEYFAPTFDRQGRWFAVGTEAGRVMVLDLAAVVAGSTAEDAVMMDAAVQNGSLNQIDFNDDGTMATAGLGDGRIRLWDVATGTRLLELRVDPTGAIQALEFSPDGSYLLYNDGGVFRRYLVDTDELIDLARNRLTRDLTIDECRQYLDAERCQ